MIINAAAPTRQPVMGHYGPSGSWHGENPYFCMKCRLEIQSAQQRRSIQPTNMLRKESR